MTPEQEAFERLPIEERRSRFAAFVVSVGTDIQDSFVVAHGADGEAYFGGGVSPLSALRTLAALVVHHSDIDRLEILRAVIEGSGGSVDFLRQGPDGAEA